MPAFDPELTQVMRDVLEDVMTRVPVQYSTPSTKAHLAEYILKAAAQGHTTYNELVTAAVDQIQAIISVFT
jgi:N-acetylglucosamine kinase-like BadF-type ATPase